MSFKHLYVSVVSASLALSACTNRAPQSVQIEQPKKDTQPAAADTGVSDQQWEPTPGPNVGASVTPSGDQADLPITINESDLKAVYANLDTKALKYRFTYITTQEGDVTFTDNKASITFKNLPTGRSAALKLEILEAGVVKFEASNPSFTLTKGTTNRVTLQLNPVGGNGGSTPGSDSTDLQVDVSIAGQGGSTPPSAANPAPSNPTPGNPSVDPIANWDGKSFLGNSKWNIVPVGG